MNSYRYGVRTRSKSNDNWAGGCALVTFVFVFIVVCYVVIAAFLSNVWDNIIIPSFWQTGPTFDTGQALAIWVFLSIIGGAIFKSTHHSTSK